MISIGRGPRALEEAKEPTELLVACHGRIRHFSELALRLARGAGAPPDQIADAAVSLKRYFSVALPLHERDEEDSLAPRLLESGARGEIAEALQRIQDEHRVIDALLESTMRMWDVVAAAPEEQTRLADELEHRARSLDLAFGPHLALEEHAVFPAIMTALSPSARMAILQEIRARRTPEIRATMAALVHTS